eukprot:scaffold78186_cov19-Tisochrysis_lutea.AAC.1
MSAMRCSNRDASTTTIIAAAQMLPNKQAQATPMTPKGSASSNPALAQMSRYCACAGEKSHSKHGHQGGGHSGKMDDAEQQVGRKLEQVQECVARMPCVNKHKGCKGFAFATAGSKQE